MAINTQYLLCSLLVPHASTYYIPMYTIYDVPNVQKRMYFTNQTCIILTEFECD